MVGELNMAPKAKKAPAKKAAAKKASKTAEKAAVDNFKKADFVASVAEKTGMTKIQSEEALNAVLDTITGVSVGLLVLTVVCIVCWIEIVVQDWLYRGVTKDGLDWMGHLLTSHVWFCCFIMLFFCSSCATFILSIFQNVAAGKRVSLMGFGTFQLRARAARKGRNPQTGEEIDIKASKSPGFTASKAFKEKSNM
jgi:nucleoid DNA-binding protein